MNDDILLKAYTILCKIGRTTVAVSLNRWAANNAFRIEDLKNEIALLRQQLQTTSLKATEHFEAAETANKKLKDVHEMFYGEGYYLAGWHLNGDLEPIDSFFDENDWSYDEQYTTDNESTEPTPNI